MQQKTSRFEFRLSPAERDALESASSAAGMSPSRYIRSLISGESVEVVLLNVPLARLSDAVREIKRVGTNLNQLVAAVNRGVIVDPADLDDAVAACRRAVDKLSSLIEAVGPSDAR